MNYTNCQEVSIYPWLYDMDVRIKDHLPLNLRSRLVKHWLCYPMPKYSFFVVIGVIYTVIGILAICFNISVIVISANRQFRNLTDYLTLNLFVTDLMMIITELPLLVVNCFYQNWIIDEAWTCSFHAFCGGLLGSVSIVTITIIAIDRFFAIVPPFNVKRFTKANALKWIFVAWIYCIIWNLPPLFGWNQYVLEGGVVSCSFNYLSDDSFHRSYIITLFVIVYCIPLTIIIFSYITIMITIYRFRKQFLEIKMLRNRGSQEKVTNLRSSSRKKKRKLSNDINNEYRIFKIFLHGVILWFIAWTPYATVALTGYFGGPQARRLLTPVTTIIPAIFCKLAACYNPILFALKNPNIRFELNLRCQKFKKRFCSNVCSFNSDYITEANDKNDSAVLNLRSNTISKKNIERH